VRQDLVSHHVRGGLKFLCPADPKTIKTMPSYPPRGGGCEDGEMVAPVTYSHLLHAFLHIAHITYVLMLLLDLAYFFLSTHVFFSLFLLFDITHLIYNVL
jgi:hypothetical protein